MQDNTALSEVREGWFDIFDEQIGLYSRGRRGLFGYTTDQTWNGWACLLFPRESVERIVRTAYWIGRNRHNAEEDSYSFLNEDVGEWDTFKSRTLSLPDGSEVRVWGIGSCLWTWEEGPACYRPALSCIQ